MYIVRLANTSPEENRDRIRNALQSRTVIRTGIARFEPGTVAHDGENHRHEHDELFIILSGEIKVPITGGETQTARAGDWVMIQAGEEHHLTNQTLLPCVAIYLIVE